MVLRRRRREEAEREVASREEKRREDGFPVNRPGRLARAQTRATLRRVRRRRRHGGLFFTKTTKMCAYVQSALINGKMCGEKLSRILEVKKSSHFVDIYTHFLKPPL